MAPSTKRTAGTAVGLVVLCVAFCCASAGDSQVPDEPIQVQVKLGFGLEAGVDFRWYAVDILLQQPEKYENKLVNQFEKYMKQKGTDTLTDKDNSVYVQQPAAENPAPFLLRGALHTGGHLETSSLVMNAGDKDAWVLYAKFSPDKLDEVPAEFTFVKVPATSTTPAPIDTTTTTTTAPTPITTTSTSTTETPEVAPIDTTTTTTVAPTPITTTSTSTTETPEVPLDNITVPTEVPFDPITPAPTPAPVPVDPTPLPVPPVKPSEIHMGFTQVHGTNAQWKAILISPSEPTGFENLTVDKYASYMKQMNNDKLTGGDGCVTVNQPTDVIAAAIEGDRETVVSLAKNECPHQFYVLYAKFAVDSPNQVPTAFVFVELSKQI